MTGWVVITDKRCQCYERRRVQETIGDPSIFRLIRKDEVFGRSWSTFDLNCEENVTRRSGTGWIPEGLLTLQKLVCNLTCLIFEYINTFLTYT